MIRDLNEQRESKENDLKYARNLLTMLNKFFDNTMDTDKIVNTIKLEINEGNIEGSINSNEHINNNRKAKINLAFRNTNNLIEKLENQIRDIDDKIKNIEEEAVKEEAVKEEVVVKVEELEELEEVVKEDIVKEQGLIKENEEVVLKELVVVKEEVEVEEVVEKEETYKIDDKRGISKLLSKIKIKW